MAKFEDGSYSCLPGVTLIGKVLAGRCKMHYSRAAVGKGHIPEGVSPKEITEPPEFVMDAMIAAVTNPVNGECQVTVQINSSDVEHGFYCTGVLLYADDPDEGQVPYTYLRLEDGPEWIRPSTSIVGKLATFDLIAAVGDVDTVTATIDPQSVVTRAVVEQLIAEATVKRTITIPTEGWAPYSDIAGGAGQQPGDGTEEPGTDPEQPSGSPEVNDEAYGGLYLDIPQSDITKEMTPKISILPAYADIACNCVLSNTARTLDGVLRFYAKSVPSGPIKVEAEFTCASSGGASIIGGDSMLPATATRLGPVKIGSGVDISDDGTISVSGAKLLEEAVAKDGDTEEMLNGVFGEDGAGGQPQ